MSVQIVGQKGVAMKWVESLHEDAKYMLAGIVGALGPIVILLVTGMVECIIREEMATWLFVGIVCLFWLGGLLVLELDKLNPQKPFIWASVFFGSAVFGSILSYILVGVYVECLYSVIHPEDGSFLAGIQWIFYLGTVYLAEALWLVIRSVIGIIRFHGARKNQQRQGNMMFRNGV